MMHISYHCGPAGNHTGLGDFMQRVKDAGFIPWLKSADHYGHLIDAVSRGGVGVYRLSTRGQNDGFDYDVPDYSLDPYEAAVRHWNATKAKLPRELDRARVWIEPINEVDDNHADWLGRFGVEIAQLANADGYKVALFGWASGMPFEGAWETQGMLDYLRYCAVNSEKASVSLHEYNTENQPFEEVYPHHAGRFQYLFDACDRHNIARPIVHITEWGFAYDDVPVWAGISDYTEKCFRLYAKHAQIKGAALWTLGSYQGTNVHNEANASMRELGDMLERIGPIQGTYNAPLDPDYFSPTIPPIPPPTDKRLGDARVPYSRTYVRVNQNATRDQFLRAAEYAFDNGKMTVGMSADDAGIGVGLDHKRVVEIGGEFDPTIIEAWYSAEYGVDDVEHLPYFGEFRWTHWPTEYRKVTQLFGANPQNYIRFELPGHEGLDIQAPHGSNIYAVADGMVFRVGDDELPADQGGHNYGRRVYIAHTEGVTTVYAHLDQRLVNVGDRVTGGQLIGKADNTGNSFGSHLHLTLKHPDHPADGYPHGISDPTPYAMAIAPEAFDDDPPPIIPPPIQSNPAFGIHLSADGYNMGGDLSMLTVIKPQSIKVLSSFNPHDIRETLNYSFVGEWRESWVVRAFLDFGGRNIRPEQFLTDTLGDVERTLSILDEFGRDYIVELHNEPNLIAEGYGTAWASATKFNEWYLTTLSLYRGALPGVRFAFPGLSPGGAIAGVRPAGHREFYDNCQQAIRESDALAIHSYWSPAYDMNTHPDAGLMLVDEAIARFPAKPIYITEASNNSGAVSELDKAAQYLIYWNELKRRAGVRSVNYFVLSASNESWQWGTGTGEVWTQAIADFVGSR